MQRSITYFISDLHLHMACPQNNKLFLNFLRTKAKDAEALYILGDLFALWLGDDVELPKFAEIIRELEQLSTQIPVYYMHGNRDFLIGKKFATASGAKILSDPCIIELYDKKVLLTHGDLLCTFDYSYQHFRKFVQNPFVKWLFLSLPKTIRISLGMWVKAQANKSSSKKDLSIYDANPQTVNAWLEKFSVPLMIHGHTHRPQMSDQRIVLGDWTAKSAKILVCTPQQWILEDLTKA